MLEKFSILHISDLHRSKESPISNSALIASLISDREKYVGEEVNPICAPNLIVVSGDIVRGSSNPSPEEAIQEIQRQYHEAHGFLTSLADNFLGGDKKRIVIIPGNHDIDWKYSRDSMQRLENADVVDSSSITKLAILKDSLRQQSNTRWSWKNLSFYRINDEVIYNRRLDAFAQFYYRFYDGARVYSLEPSEQYDIFDYPDLQLSIAAFNSCYNNDHLRLAGDIHPDCISKASIEIRNLVKRGRLILATWHHNTKGAPFESNYMDSSVLKNFIDSKISIGLHGHQHRTEALHEYSDIIEQKKLIVFSAGTLCGGPDELPTGTNRQYNIIELEKRAQEGKIRITLHVREKSESSSFSNPIWIPGRIASRNLSSHSFEIVDPRKLDLTTQLLEIEMLINEKDFQTAKSKLLVMDAENGFVRSFLLECVIETEDYDLAIERFLQPRSIKESITILNALLALRRRDLINPLLENMETSMKQDSSVEYLINQVKAKLHV
ncbi:metallophosphoesterase family protein [Dyadobacter sp. BHUBP1]|uniref:metallophosphoesterase family protein n=1 Tax=Dyadobacter sp. BHUBP1 TaxID=3424178 RepID=UPI003D3330D2